MTFDIQNGVLVRVRHCDAHVTIPDSVASIGELAFVNCTSLQSVSIPDSVTSIGNFAFAGCTSLQSISIPDSVTSIGIRAFSYCTSLQSVSIPDSVASIEFRLFDGCTSLQSVTIPDSVASIEFRAFDNCPSLRSFFISPKHFQCSELPLHQADSITCIAPISDIPDEYHLKACVGFALNEQKYSQEMRSDYLNYIRTHAAEMCKAALEHPELLRLLQRECLIDAASFPALLDETLRREATELTAMLLEYQAAHLSESIGQDLSLDDWDTADSTFTTEQTGGLFNRLLAWLRRKNF